MEDSHKQRTSGDDKTARWASEAMQRGWTQVSNEILLDARLSPIAFKLFVLLSHYAWAAEDEWPGQEGLAKLVGCSEKRLRVAIKELVEAGLLETQRRGLGLTNSYRLMDEIARSRTGESARSGTGLRPVPSSPSRPLEDKDPSGPTPTVDSAAISEVYDYWRERRAKTRASYDSISSARRSKILARLKDGFSREDLLRAIDGVCVDVERWPDRAKWDDITTIFRSREKVDYFLEIGQRPLRGDEKLTARQVFERYGQEDA